jgi:hypothetical protein
MLYWNVCFQSIACWCMVRTTKTELSVIFTAHGTSTKGWRLRNKNLNVVTRIRMSEMFWRSFSGMLGIFPCEIMPSLNHSQPTRRASRWWRHHYSFISCDLSGVSCRVTDEMCCWNMAGGRYLWNILILMWLTRDVNCIRVELIVQQMCRVKNICSSELQNGTKELLAKSGNKCLTVVVHEKICVSSCEIPGQIMWTHKSVRMYKARTVPRHPVKIYLSTFSVYILTFPLCTGDRGGTVVKVLRYKSEGSWFDSRWCHWNFSLT